MICFNRVMGDVLPWTGGSQPGLFKFPSIIVWGEPKIMICFNRVMGDVLPWTGGSQPGLFRFPPNIQFGGNPCKIMICFNRDWM